MARNNTLWFLHFASLHFVRSQPFTFAPMACSSFDHLPWESSMRTFASASTICPSFPRPGPPIQWERPNHQTGPRPPPRLVRFHLFPSSDWWSVPDPPLPLVHTSVQESVPRRFAHGISRAPHARWRDERASSPLLAHLRSQGYDLPLVGPLACKPGTRRTEKSAPGPGSSACRRRNRRKKCANASRL